MCVTLHKKLKLNLIQQCESLEGVFICICDWFHWLWLLLRMVVARNVWRAFVARTTGGCQKLTLLAVLSKF